VFEGTFDGAPSGFDMQCSDPGTPFSGHTGRRIDFRVTNRGTEPRAFGVGSG
jgi:hypothetical protein